MKLIVPRPGEDLWSLAKRCNALYICSKVGDVREGPLVPYAGLDAQGRNLVGDLYFNFRRIEPHPRVVAVFAEAVCAKLRGQMLLDTFDTVCGIPEGGRTFGEMFALVANKKFAYAIKKEKPTPEGKKQEYAWDLSQFEFERGERVAIAEDVFNNFQNTDNTLSQIATTGADVVLLVGALNRSPRYDTHYFAKVGPFAGGLPVVAAIREAYPEYEQDDPEVAADVAAKNIEWEVKKNWARLLAVMDK